MGEAKTAFLGIIKDANRGAWDVLHAMAQASGTNVAMSWVFGMLTAYGLQNARLLTRGQTEWVTWGLTGLVGANIATEFAEILAGGGDAGSMIADGTQVHYTERQEGGIPDDDVEARRAIGQLQAQMAQLVTESKANRRAQELLRP